MAKKKTETERERPTLRKLRELRGTIDDLQRQVSRLTALLTEIQTADTKVLSRAIAQADAFTETRGVLHGLLDELGKDYATALSNKARRILGRPEAQLKSTIQGLLEQHAKSTESLALAN
jgi:prefoldin subunit 5